MLKKLKAKLKNKGIRTEILCALGVIALALVVIALIPNHLSSKKFNSYFRKEGFYKYTDLNDFIHLSQNPGRVLEGVKTGYAYITLTGNEAQNAFDNYVNNKFDYGVKKASLAKYVGSFGVPISNGYYYMFVFKSGKDAKAFYDHYSENAMPRKTERGEEKGYSYSICDSDHHIACYLERNTVLMIDGNTQLYNFEDFCDYMGIKAPPCNWKDRSN